MAITRRIIEGADIVRDALLDDTNDNFEDTYEVSNDVETAKLPFDTMTEKIEDMDTKIAADRAESTIPFDNVAEAKAITYIPYDGQKFTILGYYDWGDEGGQPVFFDAASTETANDGTIFEIASTVIGRLKTLVPEGQVTDKMFGVKCDGSDDYIRLQAAFDGSGSKLLLADGSRYISEPITIDKSGFKLFGVSEATTLIRPFAGFSGTYLMDWGNITVSRNRCEIRNVGFNGNGLVGITAVRWRRINNTSKIIYCSFESLEGGIVFDELALANTIGFNRFWGVTTNIELIDEAGNSTLIIGNYFASGRVYINNSMTDVKIMNNTFDSSAHIFSDGVSGPRGFDIIANRFEQNSNISPLQLGIVRGLMCTGNTFLGGTFADIAIELIGTSALGRYDIHDNHFEEYNVSYIKSTEVPDYKVLQYANMDDGSASTPYDTNKLKSPNEDLTAEDGIVKVCEDQMYFGEDYKVLEYTVEAIIAASGVFQSIFSITTDATRKGAYTCDVEVLAAFTPTSTAVAAMGSRTAFSHVNDSAGAPANGGTIEVYQTPSAATASGTRDISNIAVSPNIVSDPVNDVRVSVTWTGTSGPIIARLKVRLKWDDYLNPPVITTL